MIEEYILDSLDSGMLKYLLGTLMIRFEGGS